MARKRKKEEPQEEYEFVPPEFDERKFLENDMRGTKLLLITVLFAVIFGIIAFLLGTVSAWLGLVVLIGGMAGLRYLYLLFRIPKESIERKSLLGNLALFFFMFLAIWVLLLNMPFTDNADPDVGGVELWVQNSELNWIRVETDGLTFSVVPYGDGTLNITARVTDNGALSLVQIRVYGEGDPGSYVNMTDIGDHEFSLSRSFTGGSYHFVIRAEDSVGHSSESSIYTILVTLP